MSPARADSIATLFRHLSGPAYASKTMFFASAEQKSDTVGSAIALLARHCCFFAILKLGIVIGTIPVQPSNQRSTTLWLRKA